MIWIAAALLAQTAAPAACPAVDQSLPAALAGWRSPAPLAGGTLAPGTFARVSLAADPHFTLTSSRGSEPGTFGAAFAVTIASAGTYDVLVSDRAWIDLVAAGATLRPTAHGEGPACTSIRRKLSFTLTPGTYSLQISGSHARDIELAILPTH
ncbi:MAG TPA: hypothetical protein VH331_04330 [Allosphingosinicella sp.]|jgi:hypothetical protein|nr:hypothetical protein [Allosphingosinicella sp.]